MKAIKVNADFESVLFQNSPKSKVNEVIEFLAFFLEDAPLHTQKNYSEKYLSYVESVRGSRPQIARSGASSHWWGDLTDPELQKFLNSKITSTRLSIDHSWVKDSFIIETPDDLLNIPELNLEMMLKDPFDMSGRGFRIFQKTPQSSELKSFPLILEPLLDRRYDFSHYIFSDGTRICYENIVDKKFQFKGTIFKNWKRTSVQQLSFYDQIGHKEWETFNKRLEEITRFYGEKLPDSAGGYSVDSFVYHDGETLRVFAMCEVNVRRTMGRVAYDLCRRYGRENEWGIFLLLPATAGAFEKLAPVLNQELILLSPEGSRFDMIFMSAVHKDEAKTKLEKIRDLLSLSELPVSL